MNNYMQYNVLTVFEWCEALKEFLLDDEKVTPFTEGLEYVFTNMHFLDILSLYELNFSITKDQFIDLIINYIDNHFINIIEFNYISNILKYVLTYWRNCDDLDDFNTLELYLYEYQLNDFIILIKKYNEWLDSKHYAESNIFREPILVEDHLYLLKNWCEWFNIRKRMNNIFVNNDYVDWYVFSTYLSTY